MRFKYSLLTFDAINLFVSIKCVYSAKPFISGRKKSRDFLLCFCCIYSSENDVYALCYSEAISMQVGIETFRSDQVATAKNCKMFLVVENKTQQCCRNGNNIERYC